MNYANFRKHLIVAIGIGLFSMMSANVAMAEIIVDPKGHDLAVLENDRMECRNLAGSVNFSMAEEHQGRAVLRGAAVAGGAAAIAGGNSEMRRRSMGAGALAGGVMRNKSKRVDSSAEDIKRKDAERSCLIGRGYNPIS